MKIDKNIDGVTLKKSEKLSSVLNDLIALGLATQDNARYFLNQKEYTIERPNLYAHNYGLDDPKAPPEHRLQGPPETIKIPGLPEIVLKNTRER